MKWMTLAVMTLVIAAAAIAAEPQAVPTPPTAEALDQQMRALLLDRERVLAELDAQYAAAASVERTAIETEYSALQSSYEIQLLELMVQYYDVTGNFELRAHAAANLAQLQTPALTSSPAAATDRAAQTTEGQ